MIHDIEAYLHETANLHIETTKLSYEISQVVHVMVGCLQSSGRILWCGNGGSAADSQHLAAELIGRFKLNRGSLNSIALTTDTSVLTAVANDFGFAEIFARQVEGIGKQGDVLVAMTTSGKSPNVVRALDVASSKGLTTVLLTSKRCPEIKADIVIRIQSEKTELIQQCHLAIGHIVCELVEQELFKNPR